MAIGACRQHPTQPSRPADKVADTIAVSSERDQLLERVADIYASVFQVYIYEDSLRNLARLQGSPAWENRRRFNADFCSQEFNDLLRQVDEVDSLYHAGELGFHEADYWIMGQDWGSDLHISDVKVVSINGSEASVALTVHNLGTTQQIQLRLVDENGEWMIDTFIDSEHGLDLKREMEKYVLNETKK